MSSQRGLFPRINVADQFMLIPAGRSGADFKLIIKTPEEGYHYTMSVGYPSSTGSWQLPIYAEKTLETYPKAHRVFGRGTVDLGKVVKSLIPYGLPAIHKLEQGQIASGSEYIALTPQLIGWFGSGQISINEETISALQPVSYSELRDSDFAIGIPVGVTGSGIVVHAPGIDLSMTFPGIETLEKRIERAAVLRKVDEVIDPLNDDEVKD